MALTANGIIVEKINNWINEGDKKLVKLSAPAKFTVMMNDGRYRSYAFSNEEFFFSGAREGKKDEFIFEFSPVDTRSWKHVEVTDRAACKVFIGLEENLVKGLGFSETTTFGRAKGSLRRATEKKIADDNLRSHVEHYGSHSAWGIF